MSKRRTLSLALGAAAALAALWAYASRRIPAQARPVAIQDGKTIDFSGGRPVVKDGPADQAALDAAVKAIDQANRTVTFTPQAPEKK